MKELFYFSFSKLLVRAEYNKENNYINYYSHKELSFGERVVIEQYLLSNFAIKTDYYNKQSAIFSYKGIDEKLIKELNLFQLKNAIKTLAGKDKEIKEQVDELLAKSLSNYYFEKIGKEIVSLRECIDSNTNTEIILASKDKMNELIKAFNIYSEKKVTLDDVIPNDLKNQLKIIDFDLVN